VKHDSRWADLVETRDLWEELLNVARGKNIPEPAFWRAGERLMRKTLNCARNLQLNKTSTRA
jgi:hypothetical protein